METFMSEAMAIEGALLSFLLALCMTWFALDGLFRLMPAISRPVERRVAPPVRLVANQR